jgi:hypothetical protein
MSILSKLAAASKRLLQSAAAARLAGDRAPLLGQLVSQFTRGKAPPVQGKSKRELERELISLIKQSGESISADDERRLLDAILNQSRAANVAIDAIAPFLPGGAHPTGRAPTRQQTQSVYPPAAAPSDPEQELELLGRDASYDPRLWERVESNQVRVVSSSNVYSYYFERENVGADTGILFVTFLDWAPGMKQGERSGPGPTYAYYDFPFRKFEQFESAADESAGKAVWDFCRVRGTIADHQHRYRLIQVSGDYIPRKATRGGFVRRSLLSPGMSPGARRRVMDRAIEAYLRRNPTARISDVQGGMIQRSSLPETRFNARPNRGEPGRGNPGRGTPRRGN